MQQVPSCTAMHTRMRALQIAITEAVQPARATFDRRLSGLSFELQNQSEDTALEARMMPNVLQPKAIGW